MEISLIEKVKEEIDCINSIFDGEGVIEEQALECTSDLGSVSCVLKLMPNTAGDLAKVAVFVRAKFYFSDNVRIQ